MSAAAKTVGRAVTDRMLGLGPGRFRAAMAAGVAGGAAAVATYKLLRAKAD